MPVSKRRKVSKAGSRSNSRATSPAPDTAVPHSKPASLNPPLVLTSEKRRGVYECDYCHSDISQLPRIRCAECPDFDLCLECFLTTDHSAAIARLRASLDAREAVDKLNAGAQHGHHQGKQAPIGSSAGGGDSSGGSFSTAWHTGSGAINHDDSHGYRVCDNTRYPMFPSSRKVVPSRPNSVADPAGSAKGSVSGDEQDSNKKENGVGGEPDNAMEFDSEGIATAAAADDQAAAAANSNKDDTASVLSHEVMLIPDDPKAVWTVEEDLRLLDGIETHGLGNWVDISEAVTGQGSMGKTPKVCLHRLLYSS
jgi:hypothetical protein